jgi:hypothetical protein
MGGCWDCEWEVGCLDVGLYRYMSRALEHVAVRLEDFACKLNSELSQHWIHTVDQIGILDPYSDRSFPAMAFEASSNLFPL